MGGGTRLLQCIFFCCLLVTIAISTIKKGWVTILLGRNRGKVAFAFRQWLHRIGRWEKGMGGRNHNSQ